MYWYDLCSVYLSWVYRTHVQRTILQGCKKVQLRVHNPILYSGQLKRYRELAIGWNKILMIFVLSCLCLSDEYWRPLHLHYDKVAVQSILICLCSLQCWACGRVLGRSRNTPRCIAELIWRDGSLIWFVIKPGRSSLSHLWAERNCLWSKFH